MKASITSVLSRPGVTLSTLRPGPEELNAAIRAAAVDVMVRFAAGAFIVVVLTWVGYAVLRRRRLPVGLVVGGLVAGLASVALTAGALWSTYRADRQETFTSTGVLGTLQQNQGILSDVEARSAQVAPTCATSSRSRPRSSRSMRPRPWSRRLGARPRRERHPRRQPVRPHAQHRRGGVHRCRRRRG